MTPSLLGWRLGPGRVTTDSAVRDSHSLPVTFLRFPTIRTTALGLERPVATTVLTKENDSHHALGNKRFRYRLARQRPYEPRVAESALNF